MSLFQYRLQQVEHVVVPKPYNANACPLKHLCSLLIVESLFLVVMASTVQLDSEFGRGTIEVENISIKRILSAKLESAEAAVTQKRPKQVFCVGLLFTQLASKN